MAIAFSNLGDSTDPDFNDDTELSTYVTASWEPPSSGLIVLFVIGRRLTAGHAPPSSVTGNNVTWTLITSTGSGRFDFSLWGANASGSTTGATTINFANTQQGCSASFFQATGVDLGGGVAAAFIQNPTIASLGTSGSITLNAAGDAANRPISGWVIQDTDEAMTHRANWTEQDEITITTNPGRLETQSRTDAFETTATCSWTSSVSYLGIAAELKSDVAGGGITVDTGNITVMTPAVNKASPTEFSHTCGADVKLLVVTISIYDTSSSDGVVSGVKYNNVPLASAALYYDSLCDGHVSVWWLALPDTGSSYTVQITHGGAVTDIEAAAVGVEGTLGSFALDASGGENTGTTGDLFVTWNAVAEDSISFAAALDDQTAASKVHPQETEIYTVDVGDVVSAEYAIRTSSGSQTMTIVDDDGDEDWVIVGAGFKEVASLAQVNKDLEAKWGIDNLVNKDIEAQYDIDVLVNKDLEAQYDIFVLVNKDIEAQWDITELVYKDLEAVWDMEGAVSKDLEALYDILNLVNKDLEGKWDISVLVNKDIEAQWDITELVYKDLQAVWDMEGVVNKDLEVQYDILNLINKDIEAQYDIFNSVYKDLQGRWDIAELINKDLEAQFDVLNLINKDLQAQFDIFGSVNKDIEGQYDIFELINKDIEAVWDIEALEGAVSKDLVMVWDILRIGTALWNRFPFKARTDK